MKDELAAIDVSSIEELQRIKSEQDVILERLEMLENKRESVSDAVFTRVNSDYQTRLGALDETAGPLKVQARDQYALLKAVLGDIESALQTARMDREELQLRHELGEFTDDVFKKHMREHEERVADHQQELAEAESIRDRFIAAFRSEEELEEDAPTPKPAPPEPETEPESEPEPEIDDDITAAGVVLPEPSMPAEDPPDAPVPEPPATEAPAGFDADMTAAMPAPPMAEADEPPEGATMILQWPKLLVQTGTGGAQEHSVVGGETVLGTGADCDIVLHGNKVSPRHAAIVLAPDGHVIKDLKSTVGTLVNGVEVTEWKLTNGDTIQIGEIRLTFKT
jgi:hypothetical protein